MHCDLSLFKKINYIYSTDYYAVANIDLFPGIKSISPCSAVSGVSSLLRSTQTPTQNNVLRLMDAYITHIYTYVYIYIYSPTNSLFVSSLLKMFRNLSVVCGWLDLVSNLQKPIILLTTNRSFHRMLRGRGNMHSTVKMAHTGAELFLPTSQNLTLSKRK